MVLCWMGTCSITFAKILELNCDFHLFCNALGRNENMFDSGSNDYESQLVIFLCVVIVLSSMDIFSMLFVMVLGVNL